MIRWGILSTANIGAKRVVPAIHRSVNGEAVAVASRSLNRAQAYSEKYDVPKAYGSYEALLADPNIDAVYIPLPNSMHAEWAIKCAQAGKPVLCEKPLAVDAEQAQHMVDAFTERDLTLAEAFMYRFHPQNQLVQQMLQEGAVGDVQVINAVFTFRVRDEDNIRLQADLAGGALMDVGCYCVNSMRFLTGEEPDHVQALAEFGETSAVDERIVGTLHFPSGLLGHFDASLRTYRTHMYEVRGTEGRIVVPESYVPDLSPGAETTIRHWRGDDYDDITVASEDHYQLMVEDFADALLNDRLPRFPAQDAVANMRVIDSLLLAARSAKD